MSNYILKLERRPEGRRSNFISVKKQPITILLSQNCDWYKYKYQQQS